MVENTPGQVAYEAYVAQLDRTNAASMPLPTWENVRQDIRAAWDAAAQAVLALKEEEP